MQNTKDKSSKCLIFVFAHVLDLFNNLVESDT